MLPGAEEAFPREDFEIFDPWIANLVTATTNGVSQTNVPSGNERRKYSVDQGAGARRFLRLTIQK